MDSKAFFSKGECLASHAGLLFEIGIVGMLVHATITS